jgi:hypothetical protein
MPIVYVKMEADLVKTRHQTELQRYLSAHANVRDAIAWITRCDGREQRIPYDDWRSHPDTRNMPDLLETFYHQIACGHAVTYSYHFEKTIQTDDRRYAPEILYIEVDARNMTGISARDAKELYLAHVAHSLWAEIRGVVSWHLHDYSVSPLRLLVDSQNHFLPINAEPPVYQINKGICDTGMPGDPGTYFRFLIGSDPELREGPSLIGATQRETIFNFTRWIRDWLIHDTDIPEWDWNNPNLAPQFHYGLGQPIEAIIRRIVLRDETRGVDVLSYRSINGCHTTTGLMVWLMRAINIPASQLPTPLGYTIEEGRIMHGAIDFPTEKLLAAHTDLFYATDIMLSPDIEPDQIYNFGKHDYERRRQDIIDAIPEDRFRQWELIFERESFFAAFEHPTYYVVSNYWNSLIASDLDVFLHFIEANGYNPMQAQKLVNDHPELIQAIENVITQFEEDNEQAIQQKIAEGADPEEAGWLVYGDQFNAWRDSRKPVV